jgi:hypothetical protein
MIKNVYHKYYSNSSIALDGNFQWSEKNSQIALFWTIKKKPNNLVTLIKTINAHETSCRMFYRRESGHIYSQTCPCDHIFLVLS